MPSTPTRRSAFALALITLFTATTACEKAPAKAFVPPPAQVGIVTVAPATIPEAYEFVGGDQALGLGRILAALNRVTKKRPGDSTHPSAIYGIEVHVDHSCGIAIAGPRCHVTAASSPSH